MALLALVFCSAAYADPLPIYVVNSSTNVTDASVQDALPAFQDAANLDFAPLWSTPQVSLVETTADQVPAGAWSLTLSDYADVMGAGGYHSVANNDTPYAKVFTQEGLNWQLVFTHELFEMLADPHVDRATYMNQGSTFYALEVADPVEAQRWAYTRPSATSQPVVISDFVTERWFDGKGGGLLDFMGHVKHAHKILYGGYIYKFVNGAWGQGIRESPSETVRSLW